MKFLLAALLMLTACTSANEVKELKDDPLVSKGKTVDGEVGINSHNQAVIRKKTNAADELRVQDMVNMHLRDELNSDLLNLKDCRQQKQNKRLGGSGHLAEIPDIDNMNVDQAREDLGIDSEGNLSLVREELFEERLKAERQYEQTLRSMIKIAKRHLDECSIGLAEARRKAGIPSTPTKAEGYFDAKGNWIETQRGAQSLDDEFEIQAERAKQNTSGSPGH